MFFSNSYHFYSPFQVILFPETFLYKKKFLTNIFMFWSNYNQNLVFKNQDFSKKINLKKKFLPKKKNGFSSIKTFLLKSPREYFFGKKKKKKNFLFSFSILLSIKNFFVFVSGKNFYSSNYFASVHHFESKKFIFQYFFKFDSFMIIFYFIRIFEKNLTNSNSWNQEYKKIVLAFSIKNDFLRNFKKKIETFLFLNIFNQIKLLEKIWGKKRKFKYIEQETNFLKFFFFFFRKIKKNEEKKIIFIKLNLSKLSSENFNKSLLKFINNHKKKNFKKYLIFEIFEKIKYDPTRFYFYSKILINVQILDLKIFYKNHLFFENILRFKNKKKWLLVKNIEYFFWSNDLFYLTKKKDSKTRNFFYFFEKIKKEFINEMEFYFILFLKWDVDLNLESEFFVFIFFFVKKNKNILKYVIVETLFIFLNKYFLKKKNYNAFFLLNLISKIFLIGRNNSLNKRIFITFPEIFFKLTSVF